MSKDELKIAWTLIIICVCPFFLINLGFTYGALVVAVLGFLMREVLK